MASREGGGRRHRWRLCVCLPRIIPAGVVGIVGRVAILLTITPLLATVSAQTFDGGLESDVRVDEADVSTRAHLARADQAARDMQWDEAIDALLRALDAEGERLLPSGSEAEIPGGESFVRYLPVRLHVQRRIADLTRRQPEAARTYRRRVDAVAERLFADAVAETARSAAPYAWEKLLRTHGESGVGPEAWRRYGEARWERGDHHLARAAWEQLLDLGRTVTLGQGSELVADLPRLPLDRSWWLTFRAAGKLAQIQEYDAQLLRTSPPGDSTAAADAAARLVLASIFSGERERATWELARFQRRFPDAEGELSGRRAPWSKLLTDLLAKSAEWGGSRTETDWLCWGVAWDRTGRVAASIDLSGKAVWSRPLTPVAVPDDSRDSAAHAGSAVPPLLAVHPVVVGPYVVAQDGAGVNVWFASTGEPAFGGDASGQVYAAPVQGLWLAAPNARIAGVPRFPLAIASGRAWARVGAPWLSVERPVGSDLHPARLVALDLAAEGRVSSSWSLDRERFGDEWTWEGPPVVVGGRAYVGLRRCDAVQAQSHVACFDLESGQPMWRKFVAAASSPRARRSVEWTQHLLTFHEGRLFYQSRVGVVACLNPEDGAIEWLTRYPRMSTEAGGLSAERFRQRDLTPCVALDDVLVVAAADQPRIFALEATTGRLIWVARSPGGESATQLLGISNGQVIASGDTLTWLDAGTGEERCRFPAPGVSDLAWRGYGRGLMAGNELWWPTRDAILVFAVVPERTEQGWRPRAIRHIDLKNRGASGGNLVLAAGMLFVAGADRLYAFGP